MVLFQEKIQRNILITCKTIIDIVREMFSNFENDRCRWVVFQKRIMLVVSDVFELQISSRPSKLMTSNTGSLQTNITAEFQMQCLYANDTN